MSTISQRQLRNDNAEIMRGVERGESYTVTRRGVPVATLSPFTEQTDLQCLRPATKRSPFAEIRRAHATESTQEILDDLRGDR